jgi:hypothetical protein
MMVLDLDVHTLFSSNLTYRSHGGDFPVQRKETSSVQMACACVKNGSVTVKTIVMTADRTNEIVEKNGGG